MVNRILDDGNGVNFMDLGSIPSISTKNILVTSLEYFCGDEMEFDMEIERLQERIVQRL